MSPWIILGIYILGMFVLWFINGLSDGHLGDDDFEEVLITLLWPIFFVMVISFVIISKPFEWAHKLGRNIGRYRLVKK